MIQDLRLTYRTLVPAGIRRFVRRVYEGMTHFNLKSVSNRVKYGQVSWYSIIHSLPTYYPSSANYMDYPELTMRCAENSMKILTDIADHLNGGQNTILTPQTFLPEVKDDPTLLAELFNKYGSDKAVSHIHDYHIVYSKILQTLKKQNRALTIFEIGLGTNNPAIISSMGPGGQPGASLRAFRDFLPEAQVFGADIDRNILFSEDRIKTGFIDQLAPASFEAYCANTGLKNFDLFIDDGLHAPESNLNSLLFALERVNKGGWIVIEDIGDRSLPVWKVAARLFNKDRFKSYILQCKSSHLFVVSA